MGLIDFFQALESDQGLLQGYMFDFRNTVNAYGGLTEEQKDLLVGGNLQAIRQAMEAEDPAGRVHLFVP